MIILLYYISIIICYIVQVQSNYGAGMTSSFLEVGLNNRLSESFESTGLIFDIQIRGFSNSNGQDSNPY